MRTITLGAVAEKFLVVVKLVRSEHYTLFLDHKSTGPNSSVIVRFYIIYENETYLYSRNDFRVGWKKYATENSDTKSTTLHMAD